MRKKFCNSDNNETYYVISCIATIIVCCVTHLYWRNTIEHIWSVFRLQKVIWGLFQFPSRMRRDSGWQVFVGERGERERRKVRFPLHAERNLKHIFKIFSILVLEASSRTTFHSKILIQDWIYWSTASFSPWSNSLFLFPVQLHLKCIESIHNGVNKMSCILK